MSSRAISRQCSPILLAAAILLAAVAPADAQYFGRNKVRYQDFEWKIYHSPHFDVYYYEEEAHLLQKVVSYAESAYDQLSQRFDYKIQEATPLIFYETHSAFEQTNVILNFIPEGTGAFATSVRNRMVLPVDLPGPELMQLILHELTHIFEYHMLFGGNLGKGVASTPPTWFMEGLASYMAADEGAREKMYLRDAVVNDRIPPVTADFGGFFAYRFGHAVFEFIEERWGQEGIRDFMIEIRNTLGGRVGKAVERTFGMEAEDFNGEFRRWLRKKYLPELVATGEPADFGRPFRLGDGPPGVQTSPAASPSGDLLVAFNTRQGQVDVMLYDTRKRELLKNLTKGYDKDFQYFVAQELTLGRKMGRDLAFSPDGNTVAFFARREGGRSLVLLDVLKGKIRRILDMPVEQQLAPAWSPDARRVAFSGHSGGQFDIFELDVESGAVSKITDDEIFDGAPVYSPDGRSIVLSSVVGGFTKLFRIDFADPGKRYPLTHGESNDIDAVFSPDGERVYFTSDRSGANNIYGLDLVSGALTQHTNSVTGCFMPTVLSTPEGEERLVYTGFWKGRFDLYLLDVGEPITEPTLLADDAAPSDEALAPGELPRFEPSIEVSIDEENVEKCCGLKFFLEDVGGTIGVSDDQTFIAASILSFSDFLGDRRIIASFQSVESFQNFDVIYADLSNRLQWQVHVFDDRDFFVARDRRTGLARRLRAAVTQTGAVASIFYPLNVSHRVEFGGGYIFRELDFFSFADVPIDDLSDDELREILTLFVGPVPPDFPPDLLREIVFLSFGPLVPVPIITPRRDDYPILQAALVGDTTVGAPGLGALSGRRWRIGADWAPDLDDSGTLTSNVSLDFRQYIPLTRRSNLAFRLFGSASDGNFPLPLYFGGLDTVRGFDFRSLVGDRAFYSNLELRFPLIDTLATPIFRFQGVRGVIFLDVGGAWFDDFQSFDFYDEDNDRLQDGIASYGYGLTIRLFGLDLNIDFAKRWDFDSSSSGFESSIWIGRRF